MKPSRIAKVNCNNGVGSFAICEASVTPAANPIAATQSQKSLRPNNSTTAPITALRIGMEAFMNCLAECLGKRRDLAWLLKIRGEVKCVSQFLSMQLGPF